MEITGEVTGTAFDDVFTSETYVNELKYVNKVNKRST